MAQEDGRLDRIEDKIDKLAEAFVSLARTEEKMISIENTIVEIMQRLNRQAQHLDKLVEQTNKNTATVTLINRMFWVVVTVSAAAAAGHFL